MGIHLRTCGDAGARTIVGKHASDHGVAVAEQRESATGEFYPEADTAMDAGRDNPPATTEDINPTSQ